MKKNCIGIIGHFGNGNSFLDGQTVKTKVLYEGLKKELNIQENSNVEIVCVDTYLNKINKVSLMVDTLKCIVKCKIIIVLLSRNGMRLYFPILFLVKKLFKRRIYHDVIGGNLINYVEQYPVFKTILKSFDGNWVEFDGMKKQLEKVGISNCTVIPNFKFLNCDKAKLELDESDKYSFCMFSRVMKEKGVTEAITIINEYNNKHSKKVNLNIWGPIAQDYQKEFENLLIENFPYIKYGGSIDYNKSVEVLTNHLALLFPTYWDGEGFPGTIIDAYNSAIPVIATDWNANAELVDNFETGWTYPNEMISNLYESIEWAVEHQNEMVKMRNNCYMKAKRYDASVCIKQIVSLLQK